MKKITLWIFCFLPFLGISQELWFPEGTTWVHTVNVQNYFGWAETKLDGDAVIDGQNCKRFVREYKLYDLNAGTPGNEGPVLIAEEELSEIYMYASADDNQVYYYDQGEFVLMYDFTKQIGETISLPYPENGDLATQCPDRDFEITGIGTEVVNGVSLKFMEVTPTSTSNFFYSGRIYQKIGSVSHYFTPIVDENYCSTVTSGFNFINFFRCYNDESFSFSDDVVTEDFDGNCYWPSEELSVNESVLTDFNVYPNPTSGKVFISTTGTVTSFDVIDLSGKLLKTITPNTTSGSIALDLSEFSQGVYFVREKASNTVVKIIKN